MPEGPEIHRAADKIARAVASERANEVYFAFQHLKRYQAELSGKRVRRVEARGKAILIRFSNRLTVYSHNQLYGRWFVKRRGELPRTGRQLRFAIHTKETSALLYSASDIEVLDEGELRTHSYLARLGPDLLDSRISFANVLEAVSRDAFARRQLGHLLLDQSFLAGVGNYLRSEILHVAGVHPAKRPTDLSKKDLRALAKAALTLSRRSYRTGGITNDDAQVASLKARGKRRADYRFFVFARAGLSCYRCRGKIIKTSVGSRRLYLCPRCQPPPAESS